MYGDYKNIFYRILYNWYLNILNLCLASSFRQQHVELIYVLLIVFDVNLMNNYFYTYCSPAHRKLQS
jgi:hypothetical protein